ncbi:MAG: alpha/beta hydrolase, partial [Prochlorotrichaceae cyanobacterium]
VSTAGFAAEKITFSLGAAGRSLQVSSIENFAADGSISRDLNFLLNVVGADQQEQFREALSRPFDVDPKALSQVANSRMGSQIFDLIGEVITSPSGLNGGTSLRSAITIAAWQEGGFTLLDILRRYPTDIRIDVGKVLKAVKSAKTVTDTSLAMLKEVEQLAEAETPQNPVDFNQVADLRTVGEQGVQTVTWNLTDPQRDRSFYVNVYWPQTPLIENTPVLVLSHGFNSNPEDFQDGAEYFASHGYVVVVPQHRGSDGHHTQRFLRGLEKEAFEVNEFIDRPLDVSYVLDELERQNAELFNNQLNLSQVGVFGHSFGGYTALALAGATIDFENLQTFCKAQNYFNISAIVQCQALNLPEQDYEFKDDRVAAIVILNPVNSLIYGTEGLAKVNVPVMVGAGSHDPATPFVYEQLRSFPWIGDQSQPIDKYLVVLEGQTHIDISRLDGGITAAINSLNLVTLPEEDVVIEYGYPLGFAFFNTYLRNQKDYDIYLQSAYAQYLSEGKDFPALLLTSQSEPQLIEALKRYNLW